MISTFKKSLTLSFFELKSKNQNTYLGFLWYFLQPLIMFLILFYVRNVLGGDNIDNFVPYLFIGVIMVHFFISSTSLIMSAIINNYDLLNSRSVQPEILILSRFFVSLWGHLVESFLMILILSMLGYWYSFLYILIIPFYSIFILGIGIVLCVLMTKFFDLNYHQLIYSLHFQN